MNGLALLIPVALGLGLAGLIAFFWAIRTRQFDDLDGAALRILIEDDDRPAKESGPNLKPDPLATSDKL
jgi:cbb3-type cytochrome oxidase maturation protein